jgi:hypothetical protein
MVSWWIRLIAFLIAEGLGLSFIIWTKKFVDFFPRSQFAERNLGGTDNLYKISGVVLVILGFLFLAGALDFLLGGGSPFGPSLTPTPLKKIY